MSTMNISLPDSLKSFVDQQVAERGYGTSSEYVRELIRRDGIARSCAACSGKAPLRPGRPINTAYFEALRKLPTARVARDGEAVVPRKRALLDIEEAVDHYLKEAALRSHSGSSTSGKGLRLLSEHPAAGSPRYASELVRPSYAHCPSPGILLIFSSRAARTYRCLAGLHGKRDIPAWLQDG